MKVAANVKGIDIDQPSIDFLSTKGINNIESFDMNQLGNLDFKPDVIVFGEIIEHLQNLQTALSNLKSIMGTETTLIISTPNLFYILNFLIVLMQNRECIHEDHKTGFTYGSLRQLLEANKLSIEAFHFVHLPRKHYYWYQQISQWICRLRPGVSETLLVIAKRST
jgi:2-polyprenyl-3-methyl-5-hydroxy-6-metoxy-1,4-benzoquinol methylase